MDYSATINWDYSRLRSYSRAENIVTHNDRVRAGYTPPSSFVVAEISIMGWALNERLLSLRLAGPAADVIHPRFLNKSHSVRGSWETRHRIGRNSNSPLPSGLRTSFCSASNHALLAQISGLSCDKDATRYGKNSAPLIKTDATCAPVTSRSQRIGIVSFYNQVIRPSWYSIPSLVSLGLWSLASNEKVTD